MYIGLDLGTSGLKGILIDDAQRVLAEATAPLTVARPAPGWSEQAPGDWILAVEQVLTALAAHGLDAVRGIGLSGQMHGATLLDAGDKVLRPCILWNDTRAHLEAAALDADPRFRAVTGNIVFPGFTAPKLVWVARHEPELFARVAKVLLPKDYLRLWLTGEHVGEMSDAAGTSWLDTGARGWSADLLEATGMSLSQMPRLVEGSEVSGVLRADIAARFGMPAGVIVAGGGGDNAASGIGVGVVKAGQAFVSHATDQQAATRAVLEGVTFAIADCRDALAATGTRIDSLLAVGGGSRSDYWLAAIATALDTPVSVPVAGDFGGAFGAARLGMMAATGAGAELATPPEIARVIEPVTALIPAFAEGHARYRAARDAIRALV